jgi:hypothetical protein
MKNSIPSIQARLKAIAEMDPLTFEEVMLIIRNRLGPIYATL